MALTAPLSKSQKREQFDCGNASLNRYLKEASQDVRRKLALCFVTLNEANQVTGYYTLSNASISRMELPESVQRSLGYRDIPVTLLGRLASDSSMRGHRHGEFLLMDALYRSYYAAQESTGSFAVVTDPIDDNAAAFYAKYGFIRLDGSKRMFIMMETVGMLFK